MEFLGDATVNSSGSWHLDISGVDVGQRVTALQIRTDDNTSALATNVAVGAGRRAATAGRPASVSDDFGRTISGSWGNVDQGGALGTHRDRIELLRGWRGRPASPLPRRPPARRASASAGAVDVSVTGTLVLDQVPTGANAFAYVLARANSTSAYRASIRVGYQRPGLRPAQEGGQQRRVQRRQRGRRVGSHHHGGHAHQRSGSRPLAPTCASGCGLPRAPSRRAWTVTGSDSTADLQDAGSVGLRTYIGSSVTNGPVTWSLDDFRVRVP